MDTSLDLKTKDILAILRDEGWHVPIPMDGVFIGNTVRVRVLDSQYTFAQIKRIGSNRFQITPYTFSGPDEVRSTTILYNRDKT